MLRQKYFYITRDGGTLYGATWVQLYNSKPKKYEVINRGQNEKKIVMWHSLTCGAKHIAEMNCRVFELFTGCKFPKGSYAKVKFDPFELIEIVTIDVKKKKYGYHKT